MKKFSELLEAKTKIVIGKNYVKINDPSKKVTITDFKKKPGSKDVVAFDVIKGKKNNEISADVFKSQYKLDEMVTESSSFKKMTGGKIAKFSDNEGGKLSLNCLNKGIIMKTFKELLQEKKLTVEDIVDSAVNNTEDWLSDDELEDPKYYVKRNIEDFFDVFYDGAELKFATKNKDKIIKLITKEL